MSGSKFTRTLGDRLLLLISALVVGAALFGWMLVADRQLGLTREHHLFVGGVLVYSIPTLYLLGQYVFQGVNRFTRRIFAAVAAGCSVLLFFVLLNSGLVPWPRSMLPYIAGSILVAPMMILAVDWLFRPRTRHRLDEER